MQKRFTLRRLAAVGLATVLPMALQTAAVAQS